MPGRPDDRVPDAAARLREGGIVAFPTETVYGLGADAENEAAIRRVFELKGRPLDKPLTLHVSDEAMAQRYAGTWPALAHEWAARFWPGPLTIVVDRNERVLPVVCAGGPTVGFRCPDHPVTVEFITQFARPIVGPSANPSGLEPAGDSEQVRAYFPGDEVFVLESDRPGTGVASTVVSLAGDAPRVLREGGISRTDLRIN